MRYTVTLCHRTYSVILVEADDAESARASALEGFDENTEVIDVLSEVQIEKGSA